MTVPPQPPGPPPPPYGPPPGGAFDAYGAYPPPPPLPYPDGPGQPYYGPPPKKKTTWWLIGGIVAALLLLGGVATAALLVFAGDRVTATNVEVGDCLAEIPDGERVLTVTTISCDEPHAGEVFAVLTMPGGDFPGQAAVEAYHEKCSPELVTYSPQSMLDDQVQLYVLYPTAETWENGDRAVTCIATLDPPRTGSLKG